MDRQHVQVVAVGNPLRGDDGVGQAVLERLRDAGLPDNVGLVDAGADPLDVVEHVMEADKVIIIDAAGMGRAPGHVALLRPENLRESVTGAPYSTHGYGLAEGLELARACGFSADVLIIGIQPESVGPATGLSPAVASSIPEVVNLVLQEVAS